MGTIPIHHRQPNHILYQFPKLVPIVINVEALSLTQRIITFFFAPQLYSVEENWSFYINAGQKIFIPKGFIFNGASIPRMFWWIINPFGTWTVIPAIVHDFAYEHGYLYTCNSKTMRICDERHYFDDLFCDIMVMLTGLKVLPILIRTVLRLFGWYTWNRYRKNEKIS